MEDTDEMEEVESSPLPSETLLSTNEKVEHSQRSTVLKSSPDDSELIKEPKKNSATSENANKLDSLCSGEYDSKGAPCVSLTARSRTMVSCY